MVTEVLPGCFLTINLGLWGWLACKVIAQGRKLIELESSIRSVRHECSERLIWLRQMDEKLDTAVEGIAFIKGKMEK